MRLLVHLAQIEIVHIKYVTFLMWITDFQEKTINRIVEEATIISNKEWVLYAFLCLAE